MSENTEGKKVALKNFILPFICFIIGFIIFFVALDAGIGFGLLGGWVLGGGIWGMYYTRDWFRPKTTRVESGGYGMDANSVMKSVRPFIWILVSGILGPFLFLISLVKLIIAFAKGKEATDSVKADGN